MLDLFQNAAQNQIDNAAQNPARTLETTPTEAFAATWDANTRYHNLSAFRNNMADAAQDHLDLFEKATGQKLENPYTAGGGFLTYSFDKYQAALDKVREATNKVAVERNDPSLAYPEDAELMKRGIVKSKEAVKRQMAIGEGYSSFGTGIAGAAAEFGGQFFGDPANVMLNTLAIATLPEGGGLLRSLATIGGTFAGQSLLESGMNWQYQKAVTPERTAGDVFGEALEAGVSGMALELGGKAIGYTWRRLVRKAPEVVAELPQPVRDAAVVADRVADLDAQNPFKGTAGAAAHNEAIPVVEKALAEDGPVVMPESVSHEAGVRRGQVFQPGAPTPADLIERRAYELSPRVFSRVDELEGQIANVRAEMDRVRAEAGMPDEGGAMANRLAQVESELAQITGKRRSSPRAKALRAELEDLQARNETIASSGDAKIDQTLQDLRLQLNDLTNERGKMGPKVRAVREHAAGQLGIRIDDPAILDAAPSHSGRGWEPGPARAAADVPLPVPKEKPKAEPKAKGKKSKGKTAPEPEMPLTAEAPAAPPPPVAAHEPAIAASRPPAAAKSERAFVGNRAIDVRYEVAELGDLVTSHDRDFKINPDYPAELQPRDRAGVAARDQVYEMAGRLEPERLGPSPEANSGAPIIGPDNVVESGNGRTLAIRAAYDMGGERAGAYRAWLERQGYDTAGMKEPVLVARRTSAMSEAERADFAHSANGSASLRMNAVEQALSDARLLTADIMPLRQGQMDSAANRDFVRAFVAKLPPGERGGMIGSNGLLSQAGVKRLQAAEIARAYGDPGVVARLFDHTDTNIKTIGHALMEGAGEWIKIRDAVATGEISAGHDITEPLMNAVKTIMRARDEGEPVSRALAQGDFFTADTSGLAARMFFKDNSLTRFLSKADMAENIQSFAKGVLDQRGKGADMFGDMPADTKTVLGNIVKLSDERQAQIASALKPEAIEKAFSDPKVAEAAEADLRRSIEQGRNRVPVEDEHGNVTLGFADAELARLDDQLKASQEIRSCTTVNIEAAE